MQTGVLTNEDMISSCHLWKVCCCDSIFLLLFEVFHPRAFTRYWMSYGKTTELIRSARMEDVLSEQEDVSRACVTCCHQTGQQTWLCYG